MATAIHEGQATFGDEAFEDIITHNYQEVADRHGVSNDELVAAFPLRPVTHEEIAVGGLSFETWRHQVGALDPEDRSRGGIEMSPDVTGDKILDKSVSMFLKHLLGQTGNVGGKGGIHAETEELAFLREHPELRRELFHHYALAHNINPHTNVVATDINTFGPDMDAIAEALIPQYGDKAGAAASGASELYGGQPDLHAPHTGKGASIVLDHYLRDRATANDEVGHRIKEAIDGGRPLGAIIQGLGKAGAHFLMTLPEYVQPVGALERNGGAVAKEGNFLDREQLLTASRNTGLSEAGVGEVEGAVYLPSEERSQFWQTEGVHIAGPAFDRNQFTAQDAQNFDGFVVTSVANHPLYEPAQAALRDRKIDELIGEFTNAGGTYSSQGIWDKIMRPEGWTPERFEANWQASMERVVDTMIAQRNHMAAERSEFVSFQEVAKEIVVLRGISRLRAHGSTRHFR
ncbi:MAG TPA: Glu/Leu/Phe/Val dehydrogenase dimerization domain-containing protein [Patescibacteria group bacterium]|nr:Glu/Leu/Phe/Val dehydrogenase dimerization domain-containing protein [Patescibacteria group bacterium]